MEVYTRVNGTTFIILKKAGEYAFKLRVTGTMDFGNKTNSMASVVSSIQMEVFTRASGKTTKLMVMESSNGSTVKSMLVNGEITCQTEKEAKVYQMAHYTWVCFTMELDKDKEY